MRNLIGEFLKLETAGGILLLAATVLALIVANSPIAPIYQAWLDMPVEVRVGGFELAKPFLLWVNDGLMAVFFFLVGLELKRELIEGELSNPREAVLPAIAAVGGIAVPALCYVVINWGNPVALKGWAIPAATDIAFALAVLASLGKRVPTALKVFLVSLAIIDDIGAIVIIALFYTAELSITSLWIAAVAMVVLYLFNLRRITKIEPYVLVGIVLWIAVLKSGVHATLAGVLLAFFIPLRDNNEHGESPLRELEHNLHPSVAFGILPLFAFANAGISFAGLSWSDLFAPVPLGIALGLFIGKQLGVFGFAWLAVRAGLGRLPKGVAWSHIYGVGLLTGIGFTMSLFVASLGFEQGGPPIATDRLGIFVGSLLSAVGGYIYLRITLNRGVGPPTKL